MHKKELGLLALILVVGTIVALINPRFVSGVNMANTANLIGLFGLFAIAQAFVIITAGIDLSVGSVIALLGVLFVDMVAVQAVPWPLAIPIILAAGLVIGAFHGLLITRMGLQPFVVTLCGLLIYRGVARFYTADATAGFTFGQNFPALEWLTVGRTAGVPHSVIAFAAVAAVAWVTPASPPWQRSSSPCTRARSRPPPTATSTSSTPSPRRCWAAAPCAAGKARSSAWCWGWCCCRSCRTW